MKKIILIISMLFLMISCSNPEETKKIEELESKINNLEKQIEENDLEKKEFIFEKNKECNDLTENLKITDGFSIIESFYNFKGNKCYYITNFYVNGTTDKIIDLYDLSMNHKDSYSIESCVHSIGKYKEQCADFENKISELKNN